MATTTPNYGWTVPTSTDLVKDGATAIETLGDAIDASMNTALGTKKAGMVLLNTTSFSGVASQSINDVFSTTYDNYRIVLRITLTGTTGWTSLRFRVSGTDNSAANYSSAYYGISPAFNAGDFGGTAGATTLDLAYSEQTQEHSFASTDIVSPFLTEPTLANGIAAWKNSSNKIVVLNSGGGLDNSTSYTGFTLLMPGGANATGTVSVYGYNK
jgi:hypothetical protein